MSRSSPPRAGILCGQLDLVCACFYERPDFLSDLLSRETHKRPPRPARDAVRASPEAALCDLDDAHMFRGNGLHRTVGLADRIRGYDHRRTDRTDRLALDKRHAAGDKERFFPQSSKTPEHPALRGADHRAGINDD